MVSDHDIISELRADALDIRRTLLGIHFAAKAGHIGTGLSCVDLLTYFYKCWLRKGDGKNPDIFVLSKGHGASALYTTLHHFGRMNDETFKTYYQDGTLLAAHPAPLAHPEIPVATGSLGHGLSVCVGIAYAHKYLLKRPTRITCLLSDGDLNEGSVWEAAMFASQHKLNNLFVVIDRNHLQGFGRSEEVLGLEPLVDKWKAFGFETQLLGGHRFEELHAAFSHLGENAPGSTSPSCVIARTVKGKGVSFMENKLEWHYLPMTKDQYERALSELALTTGDHENRFRKVG